MANNIFGSLFNSNNYTQNQIKKDVPKKTTFAKPVEYDFSTASTHDWSKVRDFGDNIFAMDRAKVADTQNADFSAYNDFDSIPESPDFDMPVAKLNLMG